ncbi:DUF6786 family protein, partial [Sphingobacterium daejeonense]|uniref:DUF6786 family protein n=1 Tax=Sphingobacterium daejeonense TaxID=371142 RepID=UPI003D320B37
MNAYGGEDRLWLGPEGGPFSLYFENGKEMVYEIWKPPTSVPYKLLTRRRRHQNLRFRG